MNLTTQRFIHSPRLAELLHRRPELRDLFPVVAALSDGVRMNT